MVVVPKQDDSVRVCVELTKLKRERHILPSVEDTFAKLKGAKIFSKLNANSGFLQIPLAKECPTDNIYHTLREVSFQSFAVWNNVSTRAFPAQNVTPFCRPRRYSLHDGRHSSLRSYTG